MNGFGYRHSRSGEKGRTPADGSVMPGTFMLFPLLCCCCAADNTAANRWMDSWSGGGSPAAAAAACAAAAPVRLVPGAADVPADPVPAEERHFPTFGGLW